MIIEKCQKWAAWIRNNDTSVIIIFFIGALIAGFASLIDIGVNPLDAIFYTLQMIVLNFDKPDGTIPGWLFHVSRLALPALASWALIKAYMTLAGRTIDQWRAKRAFDHIVICGSGAQAKAIAAAHLAQNGKSTKNIVLLSLEHNRPELEKLQREGVKILEGDATDAEALSRMSIHRAAIIYIVAGTDEANLRILEAVKEARSSKAVSGQATCLVHVFDDYLFRQVSASTKDWEDSVHLAVVPFNSWKESARCALAQIGPDLYSHRTAAHSGELHALVIGYSWFGQQLIEQLAHLGHYACAEKLKVTLVAPCENFSRSRLLTRFPALDKPHNLQAWGETAELLPLIDLQFIEAPMDGFSTNELIQHIMPSVSVAYICAEDAEAGMAATNSLLLQTPQLKFPIFVSTTKGLAPIRRFVESGSTRVRVFDALEKGFQLEDNEAYLRQYTEREAALVDLYFAQQYDLGRLPSILNKVNISDLAVSLRSGDEAFVSSPAWLDLERYWRGLPEWMKESSRDTVRHLPIKQRAISDNFLVQELSEREKEILSRMEHTRWVAERLLSGWRYAPKQTGNSEKQLHHDLIPFHKLSEQSKQKDAAIIHILRFLAKGRPVGAPSERIFAQSPASSGDQADVKIAA